VEAVGERVCESDENGESDSFYFPAKLLNDHLFTEQIFVKHLMSAREAVKIQLHKTTCHCPHEKES
jgi:hypothetical protein